MPSKRQRVSRGIRARVTEAAIAAFRAGNKAQLHRELHLRPWQESPLFAMGECPWPPSCGGARTWADSVALRRELLDAH